MIHSITRSGQIEFIKIPNKLAAELHTNTGNGCWASQNIQCYPIIFRVPTPSGLSLKLKLHIPLRLIESPKCVSVPWTLGINQISRLINEWTKLSKNYCANISSSYPV